MVGGDDDAVAQLEPVFRALAPEDGYAHVGAVRRRALREDGPQRDRVRPDAGLRRGLRGDEVVGVRPRPARDRRHLALRLGRPLVAARAAARRVREGGRRSSSRSAATSRTPARAAGRSPRRSPRTCPVPVITRRAVRALRLAAGRVVRGQGERGAAQPVRRPRRRSRRSMSSRCRRQRPQPARRGAAPAPAPGRRASSSSSARRAT